MRRVRSDDAERAGAQADLRVARIGRLEVLHDALAPLEAQIPRECDLFDIGLMPGTSPRLFIDMIGFVEMGRDARTYHFLQDTRYGRLKLAESVEVETMVDAITDYVARRLLERDKALAAEDAAHARPAPVRPASAPTRARRPGAIRWLGIGFAFLIDVLGSIAFFTILAAIGWVVYNGLHGHV